MQFAEERRLVMGLIIKDHFHFHLTETIYMKIAGLFLSQNCEGEGILAYKRLNSKQLTYFSSRL